MCQPPSNRRFQASHPVRMVAAKSRTGSFSAACQGLCDRRSRAECQELAGQMACSRRPSAQAYHWPHAAARPSAGRLAEPTAGACSRIRSSDRPIVTPELSHMPATLGLDELRDHADWRAVEAGGRPVRPARPPRRAGPDPAPPDELADVGGGRRPRLLRPDPPRRPAGDQPRHEGSRPPAGAASPPALRSPGSSRPRPGPSPGSRWAPSPTWHRRRWPDGPISPNPQSGGRVQPHHRAATCPVHRTCRAGGASSAPVARPGSCRRRLTDESVKPLVGQVR